MNEPARVRLRLWEPNRLKDVRLGEGLAGPVDRFPRVKGGHRKPRACASRTTEHRPHRLPQRSGISNVVAPAMSERVHTPQSRLRRISTSARLLASPGLWSLLAQAGTLIVGLWSLLALRGSGSHENRGSWGLLAMVQ
jgi:hypothetical protein